MERELSLRRGLFRNVENTNHLKISLSPASDSNESIFTTNNQPTTPLAAPQSEWKGYLNYCKTTILIIVWLTCSYALMSNNETVQDMHQISIQQKAINSYIIYNRPNTSKINIILEGAMLPPYYGNLSTNWLTIWVQLLKVKKMPKSTSDIKSSDVISMRNVSEVWMVPLVTEKLIGVVPEVNYHKTLDLNVSHDNDLSFKFLRLQFKSNLNTNLPLFLGYNLQPISPDDGIIYAALVLLGLYILIIFDIVHKTVAAMLASTISVAILAVLNARPTLQEILSWMEVGTLLFLFSMMLLVTIFSETGVFDFFALWAYKKTNGKIWPLINILCLLVLILAAVLDNLTTILLTTPATIKLCEIMKLNPVPVLLITLIVGNIAGGITPIGDPPNVIILGNKDVIASGITFGNFTLHMGTGVLITIAIVYLQMRFYFRKSDCFKYNDTEEVHDIKSEIAALKRTAASVSSYSKDENAVKENLLKESTKLQGKLKKVKINENYLNFHEQRQEELENLNQQCVIRNKPLLIKSGITLILVISVLFCHSIPMLSRLGMGWTSLLGALLLLLLYSKEDVEGVFSRIEWSTLLFFASLFVLMEALSKLGLIEYVGKQTQYLIISVHPDARLAVAIVLILWVSAIVSAVVDNLPLTAMMVKVASDLASNRELQLPLQPLIWALAFGACLGGNATLFGSSSNIVCAGVAEQHGYKFSFVHFLKIGLPITITSLIIVTAYLIVCHIVFQWH